MRIRIVGIGEDGQWDFAEAVQRQQDATDEDEEDQCENGAHVTSQHHAYWPTPNRQSEFIIFIYPNNRNSIQSKR